MICSQCFFEKTCDFVDYKWVCRDCTGIDQTVFILVKREDMSELRLKKEVNYSLDEIVKHLQKINAFLDKYLGEK